MKKSAIILFLLCVFATRAQVTYINDTIPVIVHVIHMNEPAGTGMNLDSTQIYSQFRVLNDDFNGVGFGIQNVPAVWQPLIGITGIRFVPALYDPFGNTLSEPGINRVSYTSLGATNPAGSGWSSSYIDGTIKPATIWDPSLYCNIWVLNLTGPLGYATFPDSSGLPWLAVNNSASATTDGVVIDYLHFGDTLNVLAPYDKGRTATHEFGHWLGIVHMYDTCQQFFSDIPEGDYFACNGNCSFPCTAGICGTNPNGPMTNNFMHIIDDHCMNMWTDQQGDTMKWVLHHAQYKNQLQNSWVYKAVPTSVRESSDKTILQVYPNPSAGDFYISGISSVREIKLFDINGTSYSVTKTNNGFTANAGAGIYFVKIFSGDKVLTGKVLIQR